MASKSGNSFKQRARIRAYENGLRRCPCCNVQLIWSSSSVIPSNLATIDHIVPKSIGGPDTLNNLYIMCRQCNSKRGNICFVQFLVETGVSKLEAEELYREAHIASIRCILYTLISQTSEAKVRRMHKRNMRKVILNYKSYFNDYLPEFNLLPRELCN